MIKFHEKSNQMNPNTTNDGGNAFPTMPTATTDGKTTDGQRVLTHYGSTLGMSLRAYYAGQALMGWAAGRNHSMCDSDPDKVANTCVAYADALIRKLEVKP